MRIFVDELPKSCEECPMCRSGKLKLQRKGRYVEVEQCVFGQYKYQTIDDEIDTCPLQTIADHDKQVRKQVCDGLAISLIKFFSKEAEFTVEEICNWLQEVKNQIEKGE